jgi:hypothetical protein
VGLSMRCDGMGYGEIGGWGLCVVG